MVKTTPRIPQLQLLTPRSKIMKKKSSRTTTNLPRKSISISPSTLPIISTTTHSYTSEENVSASKKIKRMMNADVNPTDITVSPTLEGYLSPPLPPPPSPEFLRRTVSDPVTLLSTFKEIKEEAQEQSMSGEWIIVKCNCECGKNYSLLVNKDGNKCHQIV